MDLPDALTTVPVLAGMGAALLALAMGGLLFVVRRRRGADPATPTPERTPHYTLHDLREEQARQLRDRWASLQLDFVDAPDDTLRRADALLAEAMRERGFPAVDADGRQELLAAHEPQHVCRYEQLREAISEVGRDWPTEQRRQALLEARTLFDAVLRGDQEQQPELFAVSSSASASRAG